MKLRKLTAIVAAVAASTTLAACSTEGEDSSTEETSASSSESSSSETGSEESSTAAAEMPSAEELNSVLSTATDPAAPMEQRETTVQGGETVPQELFDTMTMSQQESGANFQVVPPVLPGYTPDSVLATVNFTLPEQEPQVAENVEFVYEDDTWKLSQSWACTLVTNTVDPAEVPEMCMDPNSPAAPEESAPAEQAPAEQPAPAPAQ